MTFFVKDEKWIARNWKSRKKKKRKYSGLLKNMDHYPYFGQRLTRQEQDSLQHLRSPVSLAGIGRTNGTLTRI